MESVETLQKIQTWLIEPLQFEFMRNAIAVGILLGILCAVVGSYLIVQQMGMMVGMISHSVVAGLPIAFILRINLAIGAFVAGVLSALLLAWIQTQSRIKADAAMALILSAFLALGVTLITKLRTTQLNLEDFLFGNILSVTNTDVIRTLLITLFILILVKVLYKELLFYTFDPIGAQASGLPVNQLYLGMIAMISITMVASMQTVGVLLVIALLIGPALTAYLWVKELHQMMLGGAGVASLATIIGMYFSYYWNVPSGAAIVLVIFTIFSLVFLGKLGVSRI